MLEELNSCFLYLLPLPLGEGWGEGLADDTTHTNPSAFQEDVLQFHSELKMDHATLGRL